MRWRHAAFAGLISALTAIAAAAEEAGISVRDAWVRETPPGMAMTAGYMVLQNNTSRPQVTRSREEFRLRDCGDSPHYRQGRHDRDGTRPQVELLPNASLLFKPGGHHLMLLNPKRTLRRRRPG